VPDYFEEENAHSSSKREVRDGQTENSPRTNKTWTSVVIGPLGFIFDLQVLHDKNVLL